MTSEEQITDIWVSLHTEPCIMGKTVCFGHWAEGHTFSPLTQNAHLDCFDNFRAWLGSSDSFSFSMKSPTDEQARCYLTRIRNTHQASYFEQA